MVCSLPNFSRKSIRNKRVESMMSYRVWTRVRLPPAPQKRLQFTSNRFKTYFEAVFYFSLFCNGLLES